MSTLGIQSWFLGMTLAATKCSTSPGNQWRPGRSRTRWRTRRVVPPTHRSPAQWESMLWLEKHIRREMISATDSRVCTHHACAYTTHVHTPRVCMHHGQRKQSRWRTATMQSIRLIQRSSADQLPLVNNPPTSANRISPSINSPAIYYVRQLVFAFVPEQSDLCAVGKEKS